MRYILILIGILCAYGVVLLFWYAEHPSGTLESDHIVSTDAADLDTREVVPPKHTETQYTDPEAFYQIIIDNNIFRPLNWEPPPRESAYVLLGTAIAADGSPATAYIQEHKSNLFYAVSVGQQVGEMTVKTITPKRVILTQNGESLTLAMSNRIFLNYRSSQSMPQRRDDTTQRTTNPSHAKNETTDSPVTPAQKISAASEWRKTP